jgi:hypothetical protein
MLRQASMFRYPEYSTVSMLEYDLQIDCASNPAFQHNTGVDIS